MSVSETASRSPPQALARQKARQRRPCLGNHPADDRAEGSQTAETGQRGHRTLVHYGKEPPHSHMAAVQSGAADQGILNRSLTAAARARLHHKTNRAPLMPVYHHHHQHRAVLRAEKRQQHCNMSAETDGQICRPAGYCENLTCCPSINHELVGK